MEDIFFGVDLTRPCARSDVGRSDIKSIRIAATGVETLEGRVPAEIEHFSRNAARQCPNSTAPAFRRV